tara:strand:- start:5640 stop:6074 length:435 start_codon:yes stop_codon:yes gene_type:complete
MVKITKNKDQRRWRYKFVEAKPKRRTSDGRFFRVQWLNNDGTDHLVDEKPCYGFVAFDDLDKELKTKYTKIGTIRKNLKKTKKLLALQAAVEHVRENEAIIPQKNNHIVAHETRIVDRTTDGQPIRQVVRPVVRNTVKLIWFFG